MERAISIKKVKGVVFTPSISLFKFRGFYTLLAFILLIPIKSVSQERAINIYPTTGITLRSTAMNFFNLKSVIPDDPTKPYPYEKNVQGLGLNAGLLFESNLIGFEYYPVLDMMLCIVN